MKRREGDCVKDICFSCKEIRNEAFWGDREWDFEVEVGMVGYGSEVEEG